MICYVLNLERHHTRLQSFLQQFDSSDLSASELRRFRAVDAASVWPQACALVYKPALARLAAVERRGFRQTHAEMPSRGGVGCALSHLCTWLDILDDVAAPESQQYWVGSEWHSVKLQPLFYKQLARLEGTDLFWQDGGLHLYS